MSPGVEHRTSHRHPVYSNLVLIDAPVISDVLLSPRDISVGGFMVESPRLFDVGEEVECTIEVSGKSFMGCQASLAWRSENGNDPPTWNMGFSLNVPDEQKSGFLSAMEEAFPESEEEEF
jgi:hypothetical protein